MSTVRRAERRGSRDKVLDFAFGVDSSLHYINGAEDGELFDRNSSGSCGAELYGGGSPLYL